MPYEPGATAPKKGPEPGVSVSGDIGSSITRSSSPVETLAYLSCGRLPTGFVPERVVPESQG
jgi:hypothetical protein